MEQNLEKTLQEIVSGSNIAGCLFANKQGLCLGAKGKASACFAGIAVAISEQACKLEPNANPPIVSLESGNNVCLIHKYGGITGVIYKHNASQR
uniref:Late endosomal/lysosomal adaptor and MAPK and MTOR activator 5 n=1 Tax=Tabanus bromius TaxID=304241 RepID=A0A0K8TNK7_TABBR